jgi:hypothetical protein
MLLLIILALPIGLAFGYTLQGVRFCINSACRDLYLIRDSTLLHAFVLAVLIQMVGVQLLVQLGLVKVWVIEFFWLANLVGGLLLGGVWSWPEGRAGTHSRSALNRSSLSLPPGPRPASAGCPARW